VLAAVSAARGGAPPAPCRPAFARAELDATLAASQAPATQTTPLVTIAIPSYNRPALLARTLASLAAQTYANIEVIVVNNGAPVDAVVAPFPFVRLIQSESNGGPYRALVRAREEMRGEYFGWLGDDDVYFPDHVSRLVFALENSGAAVAHSNAVSRFVVSRDGEEHAIAHKVQFERALDPFTIVCGTTLADGATLCRRSVFEEIGTYDVTLPDADLDWQIRMARAYDFVHVDNVTFRWTQDVRGTSYGQSTAALTSLRDVYERYPTHSAALERIRAANLRRFACNEPGMYWPPDLMLPDDWEAQMHRTRTGEHTFPQEPVT
jgi:glycosyltransferase involved in cell wall biosynthesis